MLADKLQVINEATLVEEAKYFDGDVNGGRESVGNENQVANCKVNVVFDFFLCVQFLFFLKGELVRVLLMEVDCSEGHRCSN